MVGYMRCSRCGREFDAGVVDPVSTAFLCSSCFRKERWKRR